MKDVVSAWKKRAHHGLDAGKGSAHHWWLTNVQIPIVRSRVVQDQSPTMTVDQVEAAFGMPLTRVHLQWNLLKARHTTVSPHVMVDDTDLAQLYHPWYASPDHMPSGWDEPDAHPLSVIERANVPKSVLPMLQGELDHVASELEAMHPPIQMTALAYSLPGGKHLLLDSNHRIGAVAQARLPFRLIVLSINGPIDGEYLPDLMHFASDRKPLEAAIASRQATKAHIKASIGFHPELR